MNTPVLYGIKNCDTVKKARRWLEENHFDYTFHDYRIQGLDSELLEYLEAKIGWDNMLNRRSTSWRALAPEKKSDLDRAEALQLMLETPTLIRRPIFYCGEINLIGFKTETWQAELQ